MSNLLTLIIQRREHIFLALMLVCLQLAIALDFGSPISRVLMLIHLGLFLLWQPLHRGDKRLVWYNAVIFIGLTLALVYWINLWLVTGWLILLIGIIGGRVVTNKVERNYYMLVMIFLVSELLIVCIPYLFSIVSIYEYFNLLNYVIAVIPFTLLAFPVTKERQTSISVDFLHAVTASLLSSLLALGCLVIMYHSGTDYVTALTQTLFAISICLVAISWLITPHTGFSGLAQLWSRSLLNIGTPFEQWLIELSKLRHDEQSADEFLKSALEKLVTLPWMAGVVWNNNNVNHSFGLITKYAIDMKIQTINITVYTHVRIGGALLLHCNLLIKLIENFYIAKVNERELAKQAYLHAIYETGSRITHDIKNLLQSMHSMITILQTDSENKTQSKSIVILKKQFPYFIQRLELAMNKLQAPGQTKQEKVFLKDWWRSLLSRYREFYIDFQSDIEGDPLIPGDLFNSVIENLLENALSKQKNETEINILVSTIAKYNLICLMVKDTGNAIDEKIARLLLKEPLESDNGLGIGLYQAAIQAEPLGYSLALKNNMEGNVCFELINNTQIQ